MGAHKVLAHSRFYTKGKWIVTMVLGHDSNALRSPWLTQGMFCIVFEAKVLKRRPCWTKTLPKRCFGHDSNGLRGPWLTQGLSYKEKQIESL